MLNAKRTRLALVSGPAGTRECLLGTRHPIFLLPFTSISFSSPLIDEVLPSGADVRNLIKKGERCRLPSHSGALSFSTNQKLTLFFLS